MPIFEYRAKKGTAETVSGQIDALSQEEAIEKLSQIGLIPVSLRDIHAKADQTQSQAVNKKGKVASRELYYFSLQLSNLIKAGVPILRALSILGKQSSNPYFCAVISEIEQGIKKGQSLSECLVYYPRIFNPFYIAMVRTGEESGNLKEILIRLAEYSRSQEEILSKVRSALAYPILMLLVGIATVIFILAFVIPKITVLFTNMGQSLPLPTKLLIAISGFIISYWYLMVLVIGGISLLIYRFIQTPQGKLAMSRIALQLPLYGHFILKVELVRFCRAMELLLKSGIPILKGLRIALPILDNDIIRSELANCHKELEAGSSFGAGLRKSRLIPPMMNHLVAVAEESGSFEEVLGDIADSYERETNESIKTMTTLLEPAMILVVGLMIGFIVMAMLLPIFQIDIVAN